MLLLILKIAGEVWNPPTVFTLHFATINTSGSDLENVASVIFTLHFATINTTAEPYGILTNAHLHYTLLLLIHTDTE